MINDELLNEFKKFELKSNADNDTRKFIIGGFAMKSGDDTSSGGKADDCEADPSPPITPKPVVA